MREHEQPQGRQTPPCGSLARPLASALVDDAGPGEVAASADEGPLRRRREVAPGARCGCEPLVQGGKLSIEQLRQRDVDTVAGRHVLAQLPATLGEGRIRPQLDAQIEDVTMSQRCGVRRDVAGQCGATQDVGRFDGHQVRGCELMITEHGGSPVAVRTAVDQRSHQHRCVDDEDHRRS
jgi:hypothetical protein